ncbi:MAG: hypothetical protein A3J97_02345 [Spirochaetes bacterium RIFOXYC1_FULL_54_7]|nr:MAG: hypothetical protein A3J97_02345 [Spirochaetes bacterium RIFOXYC1_FULL_54_7]
MTRAERRTRWEASFSPNKLALAGAALSLSLLLQPSLTGRVLILASAAMAAMASGRKLSPLLTITVMAGIIGTNLLVPMGRKLAGFGPLVITEIALLEGIEKAITFEALIFISKACLGPGLRFPGHMGNLFAETFRIYDRILEQRGSVHLKTFMLDIDGILNSVYYSDETSDTGYSGGTGASETWHNNIGPEHGSHAGDRLLPLVVGLSLLAFII